MVSRRGLVDVTQMGENKFTYDGMNMLLYQRYLESILRLSCATP